MENWIWVVLVIVALLVGNLAGYYMYAPDDVVGQINNSACSKIKNPEVCAMASSCAWYSGGGSGFCGGALSGM